jgi:hypothetical protein
MTGDYVIYNFHFQEKNCGKDKVPIHFKPWQNNHTYVRCIFNLTKWFSSRLNHVFPNSLVQIIINPWSVSRQVNSLFQFEFSTQFDIQLPLSINPSFP